MWNGGCKLYAKMKSISGCLNSVIWHPVYLHKSLFLFPFVQIFVCALYCSYSHSNVMASQPNCPPPGALGCMYSSASFVQHRYCLPSAPSTSVEKPLILHLLIDSGCHYFKVIFLSFLLTLYRFLFLRR